MSRADFSIVDIELEDILLDLGNARIRSGQDQSDCMTRILVKESQMLALMQDIATTGLSTMPILVKPTGSGKYVVWDGNRRVTALKLLLEPENCPEAHLVPKIRNIVGAASVAIPKKIECHSSDNEDALVEEIIRRHAGAMNGAGQLDWHAYMKTVFFLNHGKFAEYGRAGKYLLWAENSGVVVEDNFPITSIHRFFTVDNLKSLGFDMSSDGGIELNVSKRDAKTMATKVISDFGGGKQVRDVFSPEAARAYLAEVRDYAGIRNGSPDPFNDQSNSKATVGGRTGADPQNSNNPFVSQQKNDNGEVSPSSDDVDAPTPTGGKTTKGTNTPSWDRKTLFVRNKDGLPIPADNSKAKNIVAELRRLKTQGNTATPIATSMLLRALLEISTDRYYSIFEGELKAQDLFHKRISAVAEHMFANGLLSDEQREVVLRHSRSEESMLHVKTIQKYVHSPSFHPTGQTLNSLWDEISVYVGACWRAKR